MAVQDSEDQHLNYPELPPCAGESAFDYCKRLEDLGHEEMFIRKAMRHHFGLAIEDMGALFNSFEDARLRYLTMVNRMTPNRSDYSLAKKVSKSLGISEELASKWVSRFREGGEREFLKIGGSSNPRTETGGHN